LVITGEEAMTRRDVSTARDEKKQQPWKVTWKGQNKRSGSFDEPFDES